MPMDISRIKEDLLAALKTAASEADLEAVRVNFLGRKGAIATLLQTVDMAALTADEKRRVGQEFNQIKTFAQEQMDLAKAALRGRTPSLGAGFDLTIPGHNPRLGHLHPISLIQMQLEDIFVSMGFQIMTGHEVESEYYNFDALNIPADHPAREMQDTFWLTNGSVLRTHTSATQVRALEKLGAPMRAIFPGRCFRYEAVDASHDNTFYQLEGLMVDREITVANLIAVMKVLLRRIFEHDVHIRMRPGFFPFVEPGFELDLQCTICQGKGCPTCKSSGWIELIPCGLVHPRVLEYGHVDPHKYSGFAFGLGLTRLAMMKYHIPDVRLLNSGDVRFNEQFPPAL